MFILHLQEGRIMVFGVSDLFIFRNNNIRNIWGHKAYDHLLLMIQKYPGLKNPGEQCLHDFLLVIL